MVMTKGAVVPEQCRDILAAPAFAHVATIGPHGEPQSNPVWFDWDGRYLRFSQTKTRQKYRNLQRNPRVALSVTDPDNPSRYLEVRGEVVRVDEDRDKAVIDKLAKKYLGQDRYPWSQPGEERVVVVAEPDQIRTASASASNRPPASRSHRRARCHIARAVASGRVIATGGVRVLNQRVLHQARIPPSAVEAVAAAEERELVRRERAYRGDRPPPEIRGKTVILVDDGLATGASMHAAVQALRGKGPRKIVVAVPVAAPETCAAFRAEVDEVVCAVTPELFHAVGLWYEDFSQTSDEEVRDLRAAARHPSAAGPRR